MKPTIYKRSIPLSGYAPFILRRSTEAVYGVAAKVMKVSEWFVPVKTFTCSPLKA